MPKLSLPTGTGINYVCMQVLSTEFKPQLNMLASWNQLPCLGGPMEKWKGGLLHY